MEQTHYAQVIGVNIPAILYSLHLYQANKRLIRGFPLVISPRK